MGPAKGVALFGKESYVCEQDLCLVDEALLGQLCGLEQLTLLFPESGVGDTYVARPKFDHCESVLCSEMPDGFSW